MRGRFWVVAAAGALTSAAILGQSSSGAVVAVASGRTMSLYDSSGATVRTIDLKQPVAGFAFSPDRSHLVIVSPDTEHGGALILIDLKRGSRRRLTRSHFAFSHLDKGETEVYDSPAFSPDGRRVAFAVHGNVLSDGNDAFENSGPIALVNLDTGEKLVLNSTNQIDGNGPCSESDLQWSSDGKWILFNCEDGAFLTDASGKTLRNLKIAEDGEGTSAAGWVGTKCILYVQTPEIQGSIDYAHETLKILNLNTLRSSDASMLNAFRNQGGGLLRVSSDATIRLLWPKLVVATRKRKWEFDLKQRDREPQTISAQLLTGWDPSLIPAECR